MSNYKTIVKNFVSNGAGFMVEALISFLMLPYIIHRVGDATYGLWAIVLSLSGYMGILNLGLRPAINKYVAEYNARNERYKIPDLVHTSIFLYSICAVLIMSISCIVAYNMDRLFTVPVDSINDCKLVIILVGVQMSLGLIAVVYGGVISGLQRYEINNGIEIFVMIIRTLMIIISLHYYKNIYSLAIPHIIMTIIGYLLTYIYAKKLVGLDSGKKIYHFPDRDALSLLFRYSSITFIIGIVGRLMMYIDNLLIASILSTTVVTYYVIGNRLVTYTKKLLEAFVNVLAPAASEYYANNQINRIQSMFLYSMKMCKLISFPCLIFFIISGREFIHFWIGYDSIDSYQVLTVLTVAAFFTFPQICTNPILYGISKHKIMLYISLIEGFSSILFAIILGSKYKLVGVACGLSAPKMLMGAVIYPYYLANIISINKLTVFKALYLENVLLFTGLATLLYSLKILLVPSNILILLSQFALCMAIYVIYVWKYDLDDEQRGKIIQLIPRRILSK